MHRLAFPILLFALGLNANSVFADEHKPDESDAPECRFCPDTAGREGRIELGFGKVSNKDPDFSDGWGFSDRGSFLVGNGEYYYRDDDTGYVELVLRDLGLDSRKLALEAGQQGHFEISLDYDELSHRSLDSAVSVYRNPGNSRLRLPAGWVDGDSTQTMPQLASSLRRVDIGHARERLGLGARYLPSRHWSWDVQVRQERQSGTGVMAGSFITQSTLLPAPIDRVTDEIESSLSYQGTEWQTRLAYYGSFFRNQDRALVWDNPYTPLSPGADQGRSSLAPDNQFHQLMLSTHFQPTARLGLSASLASGRMEQDEDFVAATINPNLTTALPRQSLEGRIDTLTANLKLFYKPSAPLRLSAEYLFNERDNETPVDDWQQVVTDVFSGALRSNLPYSFEQQRFRLGADWRLNRQQRLSAGIEQDERKRQNQAVEKTDEQTLWLKWRLRAGRLGDLYLRLATSSRDGSQFENVSAISPPENPRMRQFHLADRERDEARLQYDYSPAERVQLGLGLSYADDSYANSPIGLQSGQQLELNGSLAWQPAEHWHTHLFLSQARIDSSIDNREALATADWQADTEDRINSFGVGVARRQIKGKLDLSLDYSRNRANGDVKVITGAPNPDFPALSSDLDVLRARASYQWRPDWTLHVNYWYEHLQSRNWALDGVSVLTLPNVLHMDQSSPDYRVHVITLSTEYRF